MLASRRNEGLCFRQRRHQGTALQRGMGFARSICNTNAKLVIKQNSKRILMIGGVVMKLRMLDFLTDLKEVNGVALSARLQCTCGCSDFRFFHTGKQTKGILAPLIIKKNGQLALKAVCHSCGNSIIVYDSEIDGARAHTNGLTSEFIPFVSKSFPYNLSVVVKYNYFSDNFKNGEVYSNQFENCCIYIVNDSGKEGKALIEE